MMHVSQIHPIHGHVKQDACSGVYSACLDILLRLLGHLCTTAQAEENMKWLTF